MSKAKIIIFIVVVACVIFGVYYVVFLSHFQNKPEFEILNFKGMETPVGYQITFQLKNTGKGTATGVRVTIRFHRGSQLREEEGILTNDTIAPEETTTVFCSIEVKPTDSSVTVVIECNEGVTEEFFEFLPP